MNDNSPELKKALEEACEGLERCDRELAAAFALAQQSDASLARRPPDGSASSPNGGSAGEAGV